MKKLLIISLLAASCMPAPESSQCAAAQAEIASLQNGLYVLNEKARNERMKRIEYLNSIPCND